VKILSQTEDFLPKQTGETRSRRRGEAGNAIGGVLCMSSDRPINRA
jgi:hypothetical protein